MWATSVRTVARSSSTEIGSATPSRLSTSFLSSTAISESRPRSISGWSSPTVEDLPPSVAVMLGTSASISAGARWSGGRASRSARDGSALRRAALPDRAPSCPSSSLASRADPDTSRYRRPQSDQSTGITATCASPCASRRWKIRSACSGIRVPMPRLSPGVALAPRAARPVCDQIPQLMVSAGFPALRRSCARLSRKALAAA